MGVLATYLMFTMGVVLAPFRPVVGVFVYVVFVAFVPQWTWRFTLPDSQFGFQKYIAIATLLGFVLTSFRGNRISHWQWKSFIGLGGFLLLSYLSAFDSISPKRTWFFMDSMYKIVLMAFVVFRLVQEPYWLKACVLAVLLGVGWNAYEINIDYYRRGYSLVNQDGWAYMNANGYALVLVMVAMLGAAFAIKNSSMLFRSIAVVASVLSVHAIYIVESRGCMLGLIVGAAVIYYYSKKTPRIITCFVVGVLVAIGLAGPSVIQEFSSSFEEELDHSAESRFYIWRAGLEIGLTHPLLGVGPFAAEKLVPKYYRAPYGTAKSSLHLHNLPLEILTGSGVFALIGYCTFFFLPLWILHKRLSARDIEGAGFYGDYAIGIIAASAAYWTGSMFNSGALIELPYILIALLMSGFSIVEKSWGATCDDNNNDEDGDDYKEESL